MYRQTTAAEYRTAAAKWAAKVAPLNMTCNPNGRGIHVRCNVCRTSWTHDRAYNLTALMAHAAQCAQADAVCSCTNPDCQV